MPPLFLRRCAMVFALAAFVAMPKFTEAQVLPTIVHDPVNGIHLLTQIQQEVQLVQATAANLQAYRNVWTDVSARILNLDQLVRNGVKNRSISVAVATAQINQISSELATIKQLQDLANGAKGNLQIAGAQARLQSEVISQLAEQRQLTISQIEQDELEKRRAVEYYSTGAAKYPSAH